MDTPTPITSVAYLRNTMGIISRQQRILAKNIHKASSQLDEGGTVALYFEGRKSTAANKDFVRKGIEEARRKGYIKGPVEVWFSDKTKFDY